MSAPPCSLAAPAPPPLCVSCASPAGSYVDHSIVEVYAQDMFALTTRVYPEYALQPAVHITRSSQLELRVFSATSLKTVQNVAPAASHALLPWWGWALVGVGLVTALACFCTVACQPSTAAGTGSDDADSDAGVVPPWKRGRRRPTGVRAVVACVCPCCGRGAAGATGGDYVDVDSPSLTL